MTPLDLDGLFWLPGKPEEQIAGRLTFDTQNGAELNLIGAFDEIDVEVGEGHPPCRILGIAGKHLVTLDQCQDFGGSVSAPGIHRQRFVPEIIYTGALFDGDGPLSFTAITIAVRHLEQWIGQSSVRVDMRIDDASNEITDTTLTITPIKSTTVSTALGELKLDFGWRLGGDHVVESTVRQNCTLRLQLASPASLDELLKPCLALQHLVTLGVDETAPITALTLSHAEHTRTLPSGESLDKPIDVYARLEGGDAPTAARRRSRHDMLFTFEDLGGLSSVGRWLDVSNQFGPVVGALLSHRYVLSMYGENRLQNAVFAAETFDRLRFPNRVLSKADFRKRVEAVVAPAPEELQSWLREQLRYSNEPRLRDRLTRLADHAGSPFEALVGDVDAWVTLVARTRNQAVVHRNTADEPEGLAWSLYLLSESAYFLVALCLLRECGAPDTTLAKIPGHRRSQWLSDQLQRLRSPGAPNVAPHP